MKSIFDTTVCTEIINRIEKLTPQTNAKWGKMSAAQMLAHCNVTYELIYENKHPKPGAFKTFILKLFIKNLVVNEKPYKPSSPTAPEFRIVNDKNFEEEKTRLIAYIKQTQQHGEAYFSGRASHSFGVLTATEWNNMMYKHLEHHLNQFGV